MPLYGLDLELKKPRRLVCSHFARGKKIILCKTLVRTLSGRPAGLSLRRMQGSFQGEAAGMTVDGYIAMARGMRLNGHASRAMNHITVDTIHFLFNLHASPSPLRKGFRESSAAV